MTTKVAISLPDQVFKALTKESRRRKLNRSAAVAEAILVWTHKAQHAQAVDAYVQGYRAQPEDESTLWPETHDAWEPFDESAP